MSRKSFFINDSHNTILRKRNAQSKNTAQYIIFENILEK